MLSVFLAGLSNRPWPGGYGVHGQLTYDRGGGTGGGDLLALGSSDVPISMTPIDMLRSDQWIH